MFDNKREGSTLRNISTLSNGDKVVERTTHNPKVEGSNPTGIGNEIVAENVAIRKSH
jgi:hypothetical protein